MTDQKRIDQIKAFSGTYYAGYLVVGDFILTDDTIYQIVARSFENEERGIVCHYAVDLETGKGQDLRYLTYCDVRSTLHTFVS